MNEIYAELFRYAKKMWRYRWVAMAVAWAVTLAGWGYVISLTDRYRSEARIYIDTGSLLSPLLKGLSVSSNIDEEVKIMQRTLLSRPNLEQVMRMNDLDLRATTPEEVDSLLGSLGRNISVTAQTKNLFSISYSNVSPQLAQSVVQSVLTIFVENNLGQSRSDMESARGFIERQLAEYELQLQAAEQRKAEFMAKNGHYLSKGSFSNKLAEGQARLREAEQGLADAQTRRDELNRQLASIPANIPMSDAIQLLANQQGGRNTLAGRIASAEGALDMLMLQYTDKHPDVLAQKRLIEALKAQQNAAPKADTSGGVSNPLYEKVKMMLVEVETNIASLERQVERAKRTVEANRNLTQMAPRIEADLVNLDRDYSVLKSNYMQLLDRRESARISQAQAASTNAVQYRVIDPPRLPLRATEPDRPPLYFLCLLLGIAAGGGVAFVLSSFNDSFISSSQLSSVMNLPVLGRITMITNAAEELRNRKELWRFGLASTALVASLAIMWLAGPSLVSAATKIKTASILSIISGAA